MRINIVPERCIGAGNCVDVAAKSFAQDDEAGLVVVLDENPSPADVDSVRLAADVCPVMAIELVESAEA